MGSGYGLNLGPVSNVGHRIFSPSSATRRAMATADDERNHAGRMLAVRRAVAAVREGTSIRAAVREFELPRSTLQRTLKQWQGHHAEEIQLARRGHPTLLNAVLEDKLAEKVRRRHAQGLGLTFFDIRGYAHKLLLDAGLATEETVKKIATRTWLRSFLRRHGLSMTHGELYPEHRVAALTPEARDRFLQQLTDINFADIPPRRIWNMDETSIGYSWARLKTAAPRGARHTKERYATSFRVKMIFAANADGSVLVPPTVVVRGKSADPVLVRRARRGNGVLLDPQRLLHARALRAVGKRGLSPCDRQRGAF